MRTILLVIHIFLALGLVGTVLLQRSEGGALGIGGGGGGGGGGGLMSGRGSANLLTRATAVLAALFIVTSLALTMTAVKRGQSTSILDQAPVAPVEAPVKAPAEPAGPTVPVAE